MSPCPVHVNSNAWFRQNTATITTHHVDLSLTISQPLWIASSFSVALITFRWRTSQHNEARNQSSVSLAIYLAIKLHPARLTADLMWSQDWCSTACDTATPLTSFTTSIKHLAPRLWPNSYQRQLTQSADPVKLSRVMLNWIKRIYTESLSSSGRKTRCLRHIYTLNTCVSSFRCTPTLQYANKLFAALHFCGFRVYLLEGLTPCHPDETADSLTSLCVTNTTPPRWVKGLLLHRWLLTYTARSNSCMAQQVDSDSRISHLGNQL